MTERARNWFKEHSLRVLALRDTPNAIAGGVAIGFFLGFTPYFGLKSWLAIGIAWLLRCNIIAALAALALHGLALPLAPILMRWEFQIGYWLLSMPHSLPPALKDAEFRLHELIEWQTFVRIGVPTSLGALVVGTIPTFCAFLFAKRAVQRHQAKHPHVDPPQEAPPPDGHPDG